MRICFIGDSLVNGTGDSECLGWAGRICAFARQQGYDLTYYNLGVRRETSRDIAARWLAEVSRRLPQQFDGRVIFSFGVNDTTIENGQLRITLNDSVRNTYKIMADAQQLFPILMVSPPPIADSDQNLRIAELSEQFARVCHQLDVPYLDVFTPLKASQVWMGEVAYQDGAHPNSSGYSELANLLQRWEPWLSWMDSCPRQMY